MNIIMKYFDNAHDRDTRMVRAENYYNNIVTS